MSFLVFGGKTGWIGQKIVKLLKDQGEEVHVSEARLENREQIERELQQLKPRFIINCAGITGKPNIDSCELDPINTIRSNIIGTLNLIDLAYIKGIHVTNLASGCIYEYNQDHTPKSPGFTELDVPNFYGSFYSRTKIIAETFLKHYNNVLTLRLRMPISEDLHPKSLISKLISYPKVIDVPNSLSFLPELLPIAIDMTKKQRKGLYNFVNPGTMSHNQILQLYQRYINPKFEWQNFTIEEQNKILLARRSNCHLDVRKLMSEYPGITEIKDAIEHMLSGLSLQVALGKNA